MNLPKILWTDQQVFNKTPLLLVVLVTLFIGYNVFIYLNVKNTNQAVTQIEKASEKPPRIVPNEYSKRIDLGDKSCPSAKAGNPNAILKFKVFESETCPFCTAENKVLDKIFPEYGDIFYGEWFSVSSCLEDAQKYNISGVPTFVFTADGVEKPPAFGFLDEGQLTEYICRVSGQC